MVLAMDLLSGENQVEEWPIIDFLDFFTGPIGANGRIRARLLHFLRQDLPLRDFQILSCPPNLSSLSRSILTL